MLLNKCSHRSRNIYQMVAYKRYALNPSNNMKIYIFDKLWCLTKNCIILLEGES